MIALESRTGTIRDSLKNVNITLGGKEFQIYYPYVVGFHGPEHRLVLRVNLSNDFIGSSPFFPLRSITFLEHEPGKTQPEKNIRKINRVSSYSARNGGKLDLYMENTWQLAKAFTEGRLTYKPSSVKSPPRWFTWVSRVAEKTKDHMDIISQLDEEDANKTIRLWEWLTTFSIIQKATLTHLTVNQALFKKFLGDPAYLSSFVTLIGGGLILERAGIPLRGIFFFSLGEIQAKALIEMKLTATIQNMEDELFETIAPGGPLISITKY